MNGIDLFQDVLDDSRPVKDLKLFGGEEINDEKRKNSIHGGKKS
jgi:hypothetical protein